MKELRNDPESMFVNIWEFVTAPQAVEDLTAWAHKAVSLGQNDQCKNVHEFPKWCSESSKGVSQSVLLWDFFNEAVRGKGSYAGNSHD